MRTLLVLLALLFSQVTLATTLKKLFEDNFYTLHVPGRCGQNIMNFLELAQKENIDLTGAEIINVEGGWVEPKFVRNGGYTPKVPGPAGLTYEPAPRYYYFHVFLIHKNKVYDFDYGNKPVVANIRTYFDKMWIMNNRSANSLGLNVYSAEDYLARRAMPDAPMINLIKFAQERSTR